MSRTTGRSGSSIRLLTLKRDPHQNNYTPLARRLTERVDSLTGLRMEIAVRRMHLEADRRAA